MQMFQSSNSNIQSSDYSPSYILSPIEDSFDHPLLIDVVLPQPASQKKVLQRNRKRAHSSSNRNQTGRAEGAWSYKRKGMHYEG